jgi:hypothetical protein
MPCARSGQGRTVRAPYGPDAGAQAPGQRSSGPRCAKASKGCLLLGPAVRYPDRRHLDTARLPITRPWLSIVTFALTSASAPAEPRRGRSLTAARLTLGFSAEAVGESGASSYSDTAAPPLAESKGPDEPLDPPGVKLRPSRKDGADPAPLPLETLLAGRSLRCLTTLFTERLRSRSSALGKRSNEFLIRCLRRRVAFWC